MAIVPIRNLGGGGSNTPTIYPLGVLNNRCQILNGGYTLVNGIVNVNVTIKMLTTLSSANYGVLNGLPQGTSTVVGTEFRYDHTENVIETNASVTSGNTYTITLSYQTS